MSNNDVRARLAAIRARRAAITPGKWFTMPRSVPNAVLKSGEVAGIVETIADCQNQADAVFIAAAPSDYDEMLAIIDALLAERPAPSAAGAAEPGNAHTWTARLVERPATTWRELSRDPFYLWETDQFIARVEAEPESIAWNWHAEAGDQDADGVAFSADEAKRAAEQWIATRHAAGRKHGDAVTAAIRLDAGALRVRRGTSDAAYSVLMGLVLVLITGALGAFVYAKLARYDQRLAVVSTDWQHIQPVEVFKVLHKDTDESEMPADAYNVSKYTTSHYVSETCYSGSGKDRRSYECGHTDTDYMARYDINRWTWEYDLVANGSPPDEMVWPVFTPDPVEQLGAHRPAQRREVLAVHMVTPQQKPYVYIAPDLATWRTFATGQSYTLQMNRMDEPIWDTMKLTDMR